MKFYTNNFENMALMPPVYTADGENTSPIFYIEDVPKGTVSLSILCHDPDATRGYPWVHWVIWGIDPTTKEISSKNLPRGSVEGMTSFSIKGYGGPSPSPGTGPHRYIFTLYALSALADISDRKEYADIVEELSKSVIDTSSWVGIYERK